MASFRGTFDYSLDAKNRLTVPAKFRAQLAEGVVLAKGLEPCVAIWQPEDYDAYMRTRPRRLPPALPGRPQAQALLLGQLLRHRARRRRPRDAPALPAGARRPHQGGRDHRRRRVASRSGTAPPGSTYNDRADIRRPRHHVHTLATLLDMTAPHVPVLAGELIELLDPQPGEVAVDCTFGAGGHARLLADRIGPGGTLIAIDRDPVAEERFAELAAEVPCATRFIRASFVDGLETARRGGRRGRHRLHGPRDVLDAGRHLGARLLLLLRRAAGHAHGPRPGARRRTRSSTPGTSAGWQAVFRDLRRGALRRPIARAIVRARARKEIDSTQRAGRRRLRAVPAPARFAGGHPAKRVFQALRIAVNDELGQLDAALPLAWELLRAERPICRDLLPLARRSSREAVPRRARPRLHLPAGPPGLRVRPRARGRAAHAPRDRPHAGRGRRQPARRARRACAPPASWRGARMSPPCRHHRRPRPHDPPPGRAARPAGCPAVPLGAARAAGPATHRRAPRAVPRPARSASGGGAAARAARRRRAPATCPTRRWLDRLIRGRVWIAIVAAACWASSSCRSRCSSSTPGSAGRRVRRARRSSARTPTLRARSRAWSRASASSRSPAGLGHGHAGARRRFATLTRRGAERRRSPRAPQAMRAPEPPAQAVATRAWRPDRRRDRTAPIRARPRPP